MFTGIIEQLGTVESIAQNGSNITYTISAAMASELKVDQSLAHDGVCLTVEQINGNQYQVTAIEETIRKTNLLDWVVGKKINLERCMQMNGRLDGHIVQGHVDCTATCTEAITLDGSWEYRFEFDPAFAALVIEKGSVAVNGTSLTCFNVSESAFTVAIIPYTYANTGIHQLQVGDKVNIEFDILGKYVQRTIALKNT
ncbi:MAG TPA: riboflavin synthase [Sediminibacterium sp.]|uniref:riboflavin synthase n=1 Tax=Sediminibacterium sp. TaxID=1917865 RepID=UPI0008D6DED5|nr:riboflavin synthase [Sediminibacterium sp.]OHC85674.1 MAG: riboflavin synthase subunit alpha [Sphingobacteriia bacterium RIFOXYC2_FULL_35_18]OHC87210.1 MAG: riboflavin synthase subunit alpha [Sphingobacteriia bacterium RIFOXYD2_FULL_35_12]HLD52683.1 riboflavin synthase [Sediminibacterium sp.]